jgi:hypothetical protein
MELIVSHLYLQPELKPERFVHISAVESCLLATICIQLSLCSVKPGATITMKTPMLICFVNELKQNKPKVKI